ncbi:hypothetical protein [Candidatus Poriferisodalis sp.]|uniref:hypothetical protein n=1 Tax=Candidatus Poriferisodalis sp. TaxID=3101277 RepID=UPI003B02700E
MDELVNVGGIDTGFDLDRNWRLRSRTPNDSIGAATYGMAYSHIKSGDVAQDPKDFGFEPQSDIYSYTFIYRHSKYHIKGKSQGAKECHGIVIRRYGNARSR